MISFKRRVGMALISFFSKPFKYAVRRFPQHAHTILSWFCINIQPKDFYVEYKMFPKKPSAIPLYIYEDDSLSDLGIILQGPICYKDDYTYETVKYYRKLYSKSTIIVSTWDYEDKDALKRIEELGAVIVLNKDPENPGIVNTNRQKLTTLSGIVKAKELGLKYVAKTRTDMCLRRPHVFQFIMNLIKLFPLSSPLQNERIAILPVYSSGTVFFPYTMLDAFCMGNVDDIYKFWNSPDDVDPEYHIMPSKRLQAKECNEGVAVRNYIHQLEENIDYSVRNHWEIMKDFFLGLDIGTVNLHYSKDDNGHLYSKSVNYMQGEYTWNDSDLFVNTENFGFVNWVNLYSGSMKYDESVEKYADASVWF